MDYENAIEYLYDLKIYGMSLGLERIEHLLRSLGSPHKDMKAIHVAGTNGKGSVCAMVSSVLQNAGYKVGLFTSPHLLFFEERICINGNPISKEKLCMLVERIKPIAKSMVEKEGFEHPTFFEIACAMAFCHYHDENVDFAVLEVGLGGRLDATNVITPMVSVITSISLDHTHVLGNTLEEVAREKAGIIKMGVPVVIGVTQKEILKMITDISLEKQSPYYSTQKNGNYTILESSSRNQRFNMEVNGKVFSDLTIHLIGEHQVENTLIALLTLDILRKQGISIPEESIREGIENTKWPGRLEIVSQNPTVILDCAHNPDGMKALNSAMKRFYGDSKKTLVLGIMRDKDIPAIVYEACDFADKVIITKPKFERAAEPDMILPEVEKYCKNVKVIENVREAVDHAISGSEKDDIVCIAGSIFNVSEAMKGISENLHKSQ
jgi:dihydrofolate synthase/folylpolyglutamate synthase